MSAVLSSPFLQLPIPALYPESELKRPAQAQPSPPATLAMGSVLSPKLSRQGSTDPDTKVLAAAYLLEDRAGIAESDVLSVLETAVFGVMKYLDAQFSFETQPAVADITAMTALETAYVFEDRSVVAEFIRRNRLRGLLLQAVKPLHDAFGETAIKVLRLVTDDEGSETLFCLVMTSEELADAQDALRCFDEHWWLSRCDLRAGLLNFDFELV
jgi:hypothetical protein